MEEEINIPEFAFSEAYNGLSFFLTQYPLMDQNQRSKIAQLVRKQLFPLQLQGQIKKFGTLCSVEENGLIKILPAFRTVEVAEI